MAKLCGAARRIKSGRANERTREREGEREGERERDLERKPMDMPRIHAMIAELHAKSDVPEQCPPRKEVKDA